MPTRERRLIGVLLLVGLALRIGAVLATPNYVPRNDAADFSRYAVSIADAHKLPGSLLPSGGPTAYRPPVYPLFLSAVYKVSGNSVTAARLAQAVVGTL